MENIIRINKRGLRCVAGLALIALSAAFWFAASVEAAPGALTKRNPNPQLCTLPEPLRGQVKLDTACIYRKPLIVRHSDTTVDCRGGIVYGVGARGLTIKTGLKNVKVRDCRFIKTGGVLVEGPSLKARDENRDQARKRSSRNVILEHLTISESTMTGVFIDHFVVGAVLRNSIIEKSTTAGVYLEYGSQRSIIRGNFIRHNGHKTSDGLPRVALTRREGLAIDASAHNTVEYNRFTNNAIGGILLYKNCHEFQSSEPDQVRRYQGANDNVLRGNIFEAMPIGVWIAARQSRDLATWDCGDPTPYRNPISLNQLKRDRPDSPSDDLLAHRFNLEFIAGLFTPKEKPVGLPIRDRVSIWLDHAKGTQVINNRFLALKTGIRIEDDLSLIKDNIFVGDFEYLYLGSPFRSQILGQPINGTRIVSNSFVARHADAYRRNINFVPREHINTTHAPGTPGCRAPWGGFVGDGKTTQAYSGPHTKSGCIRHQRLCTRGHLSGLGDRPRCR